MSVDELPHEELVAHAERAAVFRSMQFTETEAHLLAAAAEVRPEDVQRLLSRGCTHAWAVRILI